MADSGTNKKRKQRGSKKHKTNKKAKTTASEPSPDIESPSKLLELPAEIRNRIYEYATERTYHGYDAHDFPQLLTRHCSGCSGGHSPWPLPHDGMISSRKFFGLTQVNKQIRAEYRPIWLRNCSVRIHAKQIGGFLYRFCGLKHGTYDIAPKLLQISWDSDDMGSSESLDLLSLLEVIAHSEQSKIEFVPHQIAEGLDPDPMSRHDCPLCEEWIDREGLGSDDLIDYDCDHGDELYEMWVQNIMDKNFYIDELNTFLANRTPTWLANIRDRSILRVYLNTDFVYSDPSITISLTKAGATRQMHENKGTLWDFAREYVKSVGLSNLSGGLDLVVGVRTS
ncbi:hypothetical protein CC80DRAFT_505807 [Byssothecium circinans]|uniref:F-box domain-containing protein n=1 Tax=Byssothecium circinans TaxID=147558 RepID=A0A6A5TRE3_9PLEO|nr:hypothetical protein CC80DRAFT_505807 [Byssothecium circinans]